MNCKNRHSITNYAEFPISPFFEIVWLTDIKKRFMELYIYNFKYKVRHCFGPLVVILVDSRQSEKYHKETNI